MNGFCKIAETCAVFFYGGAEQLHIVPVNCREGALYKKRTHNSDNCELLLFQMKFLSFQRWNSFDSCWEGTFGVERTRNGWLEHTVYEEEFRQRKCERNSIEKHYWMNFHRSSYMATLATNFVCWSSSHLGRCEIWNFDVFVCVTISKTDFLFSFSDIRMCFHLKIFNF